MLPKEDFTEHLKGSTETWTCTYKPNMTKDEEEYQEHRSIQHPKQDYEYGQKGWELLGGRCQDEWDLKNGHRKERQYEELMRDRSSRKTVMRNTNDDMEDEENNRKTKAYVTLHTGLMWMPSALL